MSNFIKASVGCAALLVVASTLGVAADKDEPLIRLAVGPVTPKLPSDPCGPDGICDQKPAPPSPTPAGTFSCGADGICRRNECLQDPDCPSGMPPRTTVTPSASNVIDCTSIENTEIADAIEFGRNNWNAFETQLEGIRGWPVNIGKCLEDRFKRDGKVVCEQAATGLCRNAAAWGVPVLPGSKRAHLCPGFLQRVRQLPDPAANRQACYFAILTHEWAHTCERGHKTIEIMDDEAFIFFRDKYHPQVTVLFSKDDDNPSSPHCGLF